MIRFGRFQFDPSIGELRRDGAVVKLQPQPARVLAVLLERAGETVTRDDLKQRIWGQETFVDFERGLNFCIAQIRSALRDSADAPRFVETVPRRGYRFIGTVEAASAPPAAAAPAEPVRQPAGRWRAAAIAAALLVAIAVLAAWAARTAAAHPVRIAVAQFDNETGDPAFDEVASGVSDVTVARLADSALGARIAVVGNAPILRQARRFQDVKAIGKALDVDYVVLGQLKKGADGVRLVAHFIRVRDEAHLWANTFDRAAFDLAAQGSVAGEIARAIASKAGAVASR